MQKILFTLLTLLLPLIDLIAAESLPLIQVYSNEQKTIDSINAQTSIAVITNTEIQKTNSSNLIELLNNQSCIQTIQPSSSSYRPIFSLRGFGDNALTNTAVLINGQPYFNPDIGAPMLNVIPLTEIEQIEISPSSNSVLYGDQAVGGVINIVTKKPNKKQAIASIDYGSYAAKKGRFLLGNLFNNGFSYQISGLIFDTNNYRHHNQERINNIFISLFYNNIYFRYNKTNHHLNLPGELNFEQAQEDPQQTENSIAYNNQEYDIFQSGYKYHIAKNWLGKIDTSFRLMNGVGAYEFNTQTTLFSESRKSISVQPKISGVIDIGEFALLPTIGWESLYGKYRYSDSEAKQTQHALYGYFEIPLTSSFTSCFGSRYTKAFYDLSSGSNKNPSVHAFVNEIEFSYQSINNWQLFTKLAESYRFPKTDEIIFTTDESPLDPQTGISYEIGITYKKSDFLSSLSLYQLDLRNEILFVPDQNSLFGGYNKNLDPSRRLGINASLNFNPLKFLQINSSYNFIKGKILSGNFRNKDIPFVARNNFRITTNLIPHDYFIILFEAIYTGARYPINDLKNISPKLGGTTIYNCGISYNQKHYTIAIRANNLANKLYYGYVATKYHDASYTNGHYPAAGLNILAKLEIKL